MEVIQSLAEFERLGPEWDELLGDSAADGVFLTHEWLFTWWRHLREGRRLSILVLREGGRLIGIAPLAVRPPDLARMTPQVLEFLGSGVIGSDYLDLILRRGYEAIALNAFAQWFRDSGYVIQLSQLRRGACSAELLAERLTYSGWFAAATKVNVCPFIDLRGHTWNSYLASLSSSHRYNFQRRSKQVSALPGFRIGLPATAAEASQSLEALVRLHSERWKLRGEPSEAFQTDATRAFHREFIQTAWTRGWLRLLTIWIDDEPAAALYGLRYADSFSFYQSGFEPRFARHSVGLVLMGAAIRAALEEGCAEYDLLHGDEEYKFHWTRSSRELGRLEAFPPHARARIYRRAMSFNRAARRMAHRVLQMR